MSVANETELQPPINREHEEELGSNPLPDMMTHNHEELLMKRKATQLAEMIPDQSTIVDFSLGSLPKVKQFLKAVAYSRKEITYLYWDSMGDSNHKDSLGTYDNITINTMSGNLEDGLKYLESNCSQSKKTILYLGSYHNQNDPITQLRKIQTSLLPGDRLVLDLYINPSMVPTKPNQVNEYPSSTLEGKIPTSYQSTIEELDTITQAAGFNSSAQWLNGSYCLNLLYKPPFMFQPVPNNTPVPTAEEWNELWKAWNYIVTTLITPEMLLMKPINLRHPFIFYLGHIPAFLDIQLKKHFHFSLTEPAVFADYFERGIDPDVDDPTKCHDHSEVPSTWPSLDEILQYQKRVQSRLNDIIRQEPLTTRLGRVLSYGFEHQAMHLETLLYMLIRAPTIGPIHDHVLPKLDDNENPASPALMLDVQPGDVRVGIEDDERRDEIPMNDDKIFGWDNEYPSRMESVAPFQIQSRPVTNGEFLAFIVATVNRDYPASWIEIPDGEFQFQVRSLLGPVKMETALNWPVIASYDQASSYATWRGLRLPTEPELLRCSDLTSQLQNQTLSLRPPRIPHHHPSNLGFRSWHPQPVSETWQLFGDGWEWTATPFAPHSNFVASDLYPGYSQDFFDGKHMVILGGSYTTHPRLTRRSFRNWYQRSYPYAFATFRCAN